MKMTPMAKVVLTLVVLVVVGFAVNRFYGPQIRVWATGQAGGGGSGLANGGAVDRNDFSALANAPADPAHNAGVTGVAAGAVGTGTLTRTLVVGINTWAGHSPGIVFNHGMDPNPDSAYTKKYGMNVKFVLLEDPAAKLAAFKKGDIDIMWNTVDNWAREASVLAEGTIHGKSIILQDWSRGGDGIVSLASINSVEDLKGHKVACTQFTPSHFLLLFLLSQSGLSAQDRATVEKNVIFATDAPAAAAMFKAKQVDAAVTWEPDLSGAVAARGDEAHVLVNTKSATNVIADTLVARDDLIANAPETVKDFVDGWLQGIKMMHDDPAGTDHIVADALKLDDDTVAGMLSGLKLGEYPDNALFYALKGGKSHFDTLFDTAFVIWRKKGLVERRVDAKDWVDTSFLKAIAPEYAGEKLAEPALPAKKISANDRAIINKQLQIYFTPGSDDIMPGSYFVLDSLGDTMVSFGGTYLRIEGNTDSTGSAAVNLTLSQRRAVAVRNYLLKNFPDIQAARFQTIGHGASNPVASNSTETGRQLNRRTDIKVILAAQ